MKTTGTKEQILFAPKNDTITLADGVASSVLSTEMNHFVRILTTSDSVKLSVGETPDTDKYLTLVANVPEYVVVGIGEKVLITGAGSDTAELAY